MDGPNPNCGDDTTGTVTDIDGNVYQTIKIGDQWWMAENLRVTHYRNGDSIPSGYCTCYNNNESYIPVYGRLYNGYAVGDSRNIAPAGWHVPTDAEWQTLIDYLGGDAIAGGKMKEAGTAHWDPPNEGATNESGFTARPGGYAEGGGDYYYMGITAFFWSSTEDGSYTTWSRYLRHSNSAIWRASAQNYFGYSVRCVKD